MLRVMIFDYAVDLIDFVNENRIHKNNIVKIHTYRSGGHLLYWWEEDSN